MGEAPRFGTSGLRGLVTELTDTLVARYTRAFLRHLGAGDRLLIGRDLRDSSPGIAAAVAAGATAEGVSVTDCGALPTPALALEAMRLGVPAIMVTGSHIPADRNGLKFYRRRRRDRQSRRGRHPRAAAVDPGRTAVQHAQRGKHRRPRPLRRPLHRTGPGGLPSRRTRRRLSAEHGRPRSARARARSARRRRHAARPRGHLRPRRHRGPARRGRGARPRLGRRARPRCHRLGRRRRRPPADRRRERHTSSAAMSSACSPQDSSAPRP